MGYIDIWRKKIAAVIFRVDGWQNRLNLGAFNFKVRYLRMDINHNNSRTGHPIKLIFRYVVYFRGILD